MSPGDTEDMTKQTFTAYGALRTSDADYQFASCGNDGIVRFHQTRTAAERFGRFTRTTVVTAAEAKVIKAAAAAKSARMVTDSRKVTACAMDGGDWRKLADELAIARHAEGWTS